MFNSKIFKMTQAQLDLQTLLEQNRTYLNDKSKYKSLLNFSLLILQLFFFLTLCLNLPPIRLNKLNITIHLQKFEHLQKHFHWHLINLLVRKKKYQIMKDPAFLSSPIHPPVLLQNLHFLRIEMTISY